MAKKRAPKKAKPPELFDPTSPDMQLMGATTMAILELKSYVLATQQVLIAMGKELGIEPESLIKSLKAVQRDELQKLMAKAEDTNPMLAAWIDTRPLDEIG
jgi:hypothetical protein